MMPLESYVVTRLCDRMIQRAVTNLQIRASLILTSGV
jgi:hypothetical protein